MKPDGLLPADDPDLATLVKLYDESFGRRIEVAQRLVPQPSGDSRVSARRVRKGRAEDEASG